MIFEAHTAYAGDFGTPAELSPSERAITGSLDTRPISWRPTTVGSRFSFARIGLPSIPVTFFAGGQVERTRPARFRTGNACSFTTGKTKYWENPRHRPRSVRRVPTCRRSTRRRHGDEALRRVGEIVENQMKFWNEFYDVILEAHGDRNGRRPNLHAPQRTQRARPRQLLPPVAASAITSYSGACSTWPRRSASDRSGRPNYAVLHGVFTSATSGVSR